MVPDFAALHPGYGLVGGPAFLAATTLICGHRYALLLAALSAVAIIVFETIMATGSPEGVARILQIFYFAVGAVIGMLDLMAKKRGNKPVNSK